MIDIVAIAAETARIAAEDTERRTFLVSLGHEGITELVARDGSPCCSTPDATAWWVVELGKGYGPSVNCQCCAAKFDQADDPQITITRIPTLAQIAEAAQDINHN